MGKKILILTLGTGSKYSAKNQRQITADEAYRDPDTVYRMAEYRMPGSEESQRARYVADPIVRSDKWDEIVILGTVKSAWSGIYLSFAEQPQAEVFTTLYNKEENLGILTSESEMDDFEKQINSIFSEGKVFSKEAPNATVRIILTLYGTDSEQLKENYIRLRTIQESFSADDINLISFDITHSFRSLPLYNLIILNYFKNVSSYRISLEHVYYGNLEVSRENNGIAQIVDLNGLVNVLEMTNGAAEFRNTGSAVTMIKRLDNDYSFMTAVQEFEWATQTNNFDSVRKAVYNLAMLTKSSDNSTEYDDLKSMIYSVLSEKLHESPEIFFAEDYKTDTNFDAFIHHADQQLALANWYYSQHRYGMTLTTAKECVRSYLTAFVLKDQEMTSDNDVWEQFYNVHNRVKGENGLREAAGKIKETDGHTGEVILKAQKTSVDVRPIRNTFAHNLDNDEISTLDSITILDEYIRAVNDLAECIHKDTEHVSEIFKRSSTDSSVADDDLKKDMILLTFDMSLYNGDSARGLLQERNAPEYDRLYLLPEQAEKNFFYVRDDLQENIYLLSRLLVEYLKKYDIPQETTIFFWYIPVGIKTIVSNVLASEGYDNLIEDSPKVPAGSPKHIDRFIFEMTPADEEEVDSRLNGKKNSWYIRKWFSEKPVEITDQG